jgi:hypothetical protein
VPRLQEALLTFLDASRLGLIDKAVRGDLQRARAWRRAPEPARR